MMSNETAIVKAESYAILTVGEERRKTLIAEHVGDSRLTEKDLPAAQFPGSGSTQFTIPGPGGDEQVDSIEGVIIGTMERRRYYKSGYVKGASDPPDCCSNDLKTGVGCPGDNCATCAFAQWGSKDPANGDGKGAQACGHRRIFVLVRPNKLLPFIVDLPPTSLDNARAFLFQLLDDNLRRHEVVTSISLREGSKWTESLFNRTQIDDLKTVEQLAEVCQGYSGLIEQMESNDSIPRDSGTTEAEV